MVVTRLLGGLGNQMFQYAAGKRLAIIHSTRLILDLSHLENQPTEETPRRYELNALNIDARLVHKPAENLKKFPFLRSSELLVINENGLNFDKNVLDLPDNVLLIGYWQSYKYFQDIEKNIRNDFKLKSPLSAQKQKELQTIKNMENPIAIQIRRGDYATNQETNKFHGLIPMEYYLQASKQIAKEVKDPQFIVISDDPDWCEKNLKLNYPTTFINNTNGKGHEDMYLMSNCRHHIIANSSFGWWGAWLCENNEKIVVAPKQWFKGANVKMADRLLPGWISL